MDAGVVATRLGRPAFSDLAPLIRINHAIGTHAMPKTSFLTDVAFPDESAGKKQATKAK